MLNIAEIIRIKIIRWGWSISIRISRSKLELIIEFKFLIKSRRQIDELRWRRLKSKWKQNLRLKLKIKWWKEELIQEIKIKLDLRLDPKLGRRIKSKS